MEISRIAADVTPACIAHMPQYHSLTTRFCNGACRHRLRCMVNQVHPASNHHTRLWMTVHQHSCQLRHYPHIRHTVTVVSCVYACYHAHTQQSLKLVSNPSVSVGKLMDERQWEGPTSHQVCPCMRSIV